MEKTLAKGLLITEEKPVTAGPPVQAAGTQGNSRYANNSRDARNVGNTCSIRDINSSRSRGKKLYVSGSGHVKIQT